MCFGVRPELETFTFRFNPIRVTVQLPQVEVRGFATESDLSQSDVDEAAAALETFYDGLPPGQQAALAQLVLQASTAVA